MEPGEDNMKIAISTFRYRVSPVFDWSERLIIIDKNQNDEMKTDVSLSNLNYMDRVRLLVESNVKVLLCGVVSDQLLNILKLKNIRVIPGISGGVDEVIKAFYTGNLKQERFTMPGCKGLRQKQHRFKRGQKRVHGNRRNNRR